MGRADFEGLPDDDLGALRPFATRRTYSAGTTLFHQGDRPRALLILEQGEVELVYQTGSERLVVQILYARLERRSPRDSARRPVPLLRRHAERGHAAPPPSRHAPHARAALSRDRLSLGPPARPRARPCPPAPTGTGRPISPRASQPPALARGGRARGAGSGADAGGARCSARAEPTDGLARPSRSGRRTRHQAGPAPHPRPRSGGAARTSAALTARQAGVLPVQVRREVAKG